MERSNNFIIVILNKNCKSKTNYILFEHIICRTLWQNSNNIIQNKMTKVAEHW